jgi:thymidylate synthase (FAD)
MMMNVELIDSMGTDLTIVNAARVSFDQKSKELSMGDEKLIQFLAKNNHWTPFGHCTLQFRIKAPIFVARQLVKHQVGLTWNEVSRRYVDEEPEFFMPETWRASADNVKQGSSDSKIIEYLNKKGHIDNQVEIIYTKSLELYAQMLEAGVCAEQARMVLPLSSFTEWYWTGSLYAFARVCNLRCAKDTQKETRYIANRIAEETQRMFPVSWKHLFKIENEESNQ